MDKPWYTRQNPGRDKRFQYAESINWLTDSAVPSENTGNETVEVMQTENEPIRETSTVYNVNNNAIKELSGVTALCNQETLYSNTLEYMA